MVLIWDEAGPAALSLSILLFQLSRGTELPFCASTAPAVAEAWVGWVFSICKKRQRLTLGRRIIEGKVDEVESKGA